MCPERHAPSSKDAPTLPKTDLHNFETKVRHQDCSSPFDPVRNVAWPGLCCVRSERESERQRERERERRERERDSEREREREKEKEGQGHHVSGTDIRSDTV